MKLIGLLLIFLSLNLYATDSVSLTATTNIVVPATTTIAAASTNSRANCLTAASSGSFNLNVVDPSSDGHTESGMAKVYVPILNTDTTSFNCMYLEKSNSLISGAIYKPLSRGVTGTTPTSNDYITFPLEITVSSTAKYMYAAVKDGTDYKIVKKSTGTYSNVTSGLPSFTLTPAEICNSATTISGCSKTTGELLEASAALVSSPVSLTVFFFLDNATYAIGDTTPAVAGYTGAYFQVIMSNRIFSSSIPSISASRRGDKRVTLTYSTSSVMSSSFFSKIGVYNFTAAEATNAVIGSAAAGAKLTGDFGTAQEGSSVVYGLTNGTIYNLSIYLVDLFGFTSPLATSVIGEPTKIEELLKKQNCFLLTSGFGEEHFVIDYFRKFRDETLLKNYFGKVFVHYYYTYAPKFALSIYNNQQIRFVIRTFAYCLYFVFNYFAVSFIVLFGVFCFFILRKNKSQIAKI